MMFTPLPLQRLLWAALLGVIFSCSFVEAKDTPPSRPTTISPNQFTGSDTERIQAAVDAASRSTGVVVIPRENQRENSRNLWLIDSAILLPPDITVMLDNCTLQLSDTSRDNLFRSNNVGAGITDPVKSRNIALIGIGQVTLKGATNPRSTGDAARQLTLDPAKARTEGKWRVSYGSDAARPEEKQTGDWRNIMILIAKVDGFRMHNLSIKNSHAWAVSFERVQHAEITDIRIHNPEEIEVDGRTVHVYNKDGIDLRQGCKHFRIDRISGFTADDFIALSSLDTKPDQPVSNGNLNSTMVTAARWFGPEDDIEHIHISNIDSQSICRSIAIRGSDAAGIHHVTINQLIGRAVKGIGGRHNALLIGGKGYGKPSLPGKIHHITAMNCVATGHSPVLIEAPVADCHFMNFFYDGADPQLVQFNVPKDQCQRVTETNMQKIGEGN